MDKRITIRLGWLVGLIGLNVVLATTLVVALVVGNASVSAFSPVSTTTPTFVWLATTPQVISTATSIPIPAPLKCDEDEVVGVDCPLATDGVELTVIGVDFRDTFIDGEGREWVPKMEIYEFIVIHFRLPAGSVKADLDGWFEEGGIHAPKVIDETGVLSTYNFAFVEEASGEGLWVAITYIVRRDAVNLTFLLPDDVSIDLSLAPDLTQTTPESLDHPRW